jgi:ubiquinone/menaquinone biosynthesis C-methylase UbiE
MNDRHKVLEHYKTLSLRVRVNEALVSAGLTADRIDWSALAPLDQFHVRGLAATKELAAELQIHSDATILDVGSGLGGAARFLAATYGCHVTGIDLSPALVDVADMLAIRAGLTEKVIYRCADALKLPFGDASFDHVWTQHVAMNIADRGRFYQEIHRVLKQGGSLAIYDVVTGNGDPLIFPVPWANTPELSFLLTSAAMRSTLNSSGFAEVSWNDKTDAGIEWLAKRSGSNPGILDRQPLGIGVVMGPEFAVMTANLARNLQEGRARLVQTVVEKA